MSNPTIPPITPLQERAIRRFEHDKDFKDRCKVAAHALALRPHGAGMDLNARLRDAITALQEADEQIFSDETITNGARNLGQSILGRYDSATVAEQESLKALCRQALSAAKVSNA